MGRGECPIDHSAAPEPRPRRAAQTADPLKIQAATMTLEDYYEGRLDLSDDDHRALAEILKRERKEMSAASCPVPGSPRGFLPVAEETDRERPGWKRSKMPVQWINWAGAIEHGDYLIFDERVTPILHRFNYELCAVCGLKLGREKVFGVTATRQKAGGEPHPSTLISPENSTPVRTAGTGLHPSCALLAYHYCPHLNKEGRKLSATQETRLALWEGEGHGLVLPDDLPPATARPEEIQRYLGEVDDQYLNEPELAEGARLIELEELRELIAEERSQREPPPQPSQKLSRALADRRERARGAAAQGRESEKLTATP